MNEQEIELVREALKHQIKVLTLDKDSMDAELVDHQKRIFKMEQRILHLEKALHEFLD